MDYTGDNKYLRKYDRQKKIILISVITLLLTVLVSYVAIYFTNAKQYALSSQQSYCKTHKTAHLSASMLSDSSTTLVLCLEGKKNIIEVFSLNNNPLEKSKKNANERVKYIKHFDVTSSSGCIFQYIYPLEKNGFILIGKQKKDDKTDVFTVAQYDKSYNLLKEKHYDFEKKEAQSQMNDFYTKIIKTNYKIDKNIKTLLSNFTEAPFPSINYKNHSVLILSKIDTTPTFSIHISKCNPDYVKMQLSDKENNQTANQNNFTLTDISKYPTSECMVRYNKDRDEFNKTEEYIKIYHSPFMILFKLGYYFLILFALSIISFIVIGTIRLDRNHKKDKKTAKEIMGEK